MLRGYHKVKMLDFDLAPLSRICTELGARLRTQRLAQMVSQAELAQRAGVSTGTIKNIERKGQASLESIVRVAQALNLSHELQGLFKLHITSIADMEKAEATTRRHRAPAKAAR
jgi:transcriptional regulator with XRE-family HTH domain